MIIIIGDLFTIPEIASAAGSKRVYNYSKGFITYNKKVVVINYSNIYGKYRGSIDGVEFYTPLELEFRPNKFIIRRYYKIKKVINIFRFINKLKKKETINLMIVYSRNILLLLISLVIKCIYKFKCILEVTEIPTKDIRIFKKYKFFYHKLVLKNFDGYICISDYLEKYVKKHINNKAHTLVVPPIFDFESNTKKSFIISNNEYILYSGSLTINKDGIDDLIEAFSLVTNKYPNLYLYLSGVWENNFTKNFIYNLIKYKKLISRVKYLGFLPRNEINNYIYNAKLLCVTRKKNRETVASFPSKLIEFLATGKPTITSNVGDIGKYFSNGLDIIFYEPGEPKDLAKKIIYALDNYENVLNIYQNCSNTLKKYFDLKMNVGKILENFI